jgi:transcriptional regulator with XRE-family HTH domain
MLEKWLIELGARIRAKRKDAGWTQEALADRAQLDRSYIGGVERGERNVTITTLVAICSAFNCDIAALTLNIPKPKG